MPDKPDADYEAIAKAVLGWASISYALGFVVVTLHTARLGLPVLELLRPIYVWIGLPLAVTVFFSRKLATHFRLRSQNLASEFHSSLEAVTGKLEASEVELLADGLGLLTSCLPAREHAIVLQMRERLELVVSRLTDQQRQRDPESWRMQMRRVQKWIGGFRLLFSFGKALNLAGKLALLCAAIYLYVWEAYPRLPQSLGGGKSTIVELVVEKTAIPLSFCRGSPQACPLLNDRPPTVSITAEMLYMTKEYMFVEFETGVRTALASGAVKSITWRASPR